MVVSLVENSFAHFFADIIVIITMKVVVRKCTQSFLRFY
jgi:hypothetical protein